MSIKIRNRNHYFILIIIVIALGLASRRYGEFLPSFIRSYAGDTLWGLMVFLIIGILFNKRSSLFVAGTAMFISGAIELSQLYQAPWINSIRNTTIGGLILGFGFLWSDIICYLVGISLGLLIENRFLKRRKIYNY